MYVSSCSLDDLIGDFEWDGLPEQTRCMIGAAEEVGEEFLSASVRHHIKKMSNIEHDMQKSNAGSVRKDIGNFILPIVCNPFYIDVTSFRAIPIMSFQISQLLPPFHHLESHKRQPTTSRASFVFELVFADVAQRWGSKTRRQESL
eukprot:749742-Hanusia_phi.AAC.5